MPPPAVLDRRSFLRPRRSRADLTVFVPSGADPWDAAKARHLLRRVSMSARPQDVAAVLAAPPSEVVDGILDAAIARPSVPAPPWIDQRKPANTASTAEKTAFNESNQEWLAETYIGAFNRLLGGGHADLYTRLGETFLERMTVFWSNHVVTEYRTHRLATWLVRYRSCLREHALGDVRQLVHEVGTTAAMLRYLDGNKNRVGSQNENYARELLELFTMGITGPDGTANYTQADIVGLARALTGWQTDPRAEVEVTFDADRFDDGIKVIFGREEAFGYDDVVPLLFDERSPEIAHFLASKLYREFVSLEPDAGVIGALADRLIAEDFHIAPVLRALLKSAHFFDAGHVGALIKTPVELMLGAAEAFGVSAVTADDYGRFRFQTAALDQDLFSPPDVKGWRGGQSWINTSTITERAKRGRVEVSRARDAIEADAAARPSAYDARQLAHDLAVDTLTHPPSEAELDELVETLLEGTPAYAWDPTSNGGRRRIRNYMSHLVSLPAYQLR